MHFILHAICRLQTPTDRSCELILKTGYGSSGRKKVVAGSNHDRLTSFFHLLFFLLLFCCGPLFLLTYDRCGALHSYAPHKAANEPETLTLYRLNALKPSSSGFHELGSRRHLMRLTGVRFLSTSSSWKRTLQRHSLSGKVICTKNKL